VESNSLICSIGTLIPHMENAKMIKTITGLKSFGLALAVLGLLVLAGHAQEGEKTQLSDDPSIGRVMDREGSALIKPVMRERWTLAEECRWSMATGSRRVCVVPMH